jgi:hypothetical protein
MATQVSIRFTTRSGQSVRNQFSREDAVSRLAFLAEQESLTERYAPTDSGDVRFSYCAAADAIRAALASATPKAVRA